MHRIAITIILVGVTLIGFSQAPYQIKSCKIDFVFSNGIQKGTKTIIFDDYGRLAKEMGTTYVDTSLNSDIPKEFIGNRTSYRSLIIKTKDSVFTIDLGSMLGSGRPALYTDGFSEKSAAIKISEKDTFQIDLSFNNKQKKIGEGVFLGKKCDIMDFDGFKIWYWKGIVLKKEYIISSTEKIYEYATSIDENYIIKEDEFNLPDGVKMR
jgi:hypothetical protein